MKFVIVLSLFVVCAFASNERVAFENYVHGVGSAARGAVRNLSNRVNNRIQGNVHPKRDTGDSSSSSSSSSSESGDNNGSFNTRTPHQGPTSGANIYRKIQEGGLNARNYRATGDEERLEFYKQQQAIAYQPQGGQANSTVGDSAAQGYGLGLVLGNRH